MHTSVIMINRNGGSFLSSSLKTCCADLSHVWKHRQDFELLVVDNASTDGSLSIISSELSLSIFPWRVVQEPLLGVNSARNTGIRESAGDFLIFVDSDICFHPGWLMAYLVAADRYPEIEVFAGKVEVGMVEGPVPSWLDLTGPWKRSCIVVQADFGREPAVFPLTADCGPVGPNMAFRRSIFEKMGVFDIRFGLRPGSLVPGAEAEFLERLARLGIKFAWVPDAVVDHPLKRQQISQDYFLRRLNGVGRVAARIAWKRGTQAKRLFGMTLYRFPELVYTSATWLIAWTRSDYQRAFYYRGQVSILLGYLHEDFTRWRVRREHY